MVMILVVITFYIIHGETKCVIFKYKIAHQYILGLTR